MSAAIFQSLDHSLMRKVLNNTAAEPPAVVGLVVLSGTAAADADAACVDFIVVFDLLERCHRMKSKKRFQFFREEKIIL